MPYYNEDMKRLKATIPKENGDQIQYELLPDDTVIVKKISPLDIEFFHALKSTLNEWESGEDEQAYKNL